MKTRLLGAAVLIALAVLFVPMFFSSSPPAVGGDQAVSLEIPAAPDRDLQTRTMSLTPGVSPAATAAAAPTPDAGAPAIPASPAESDHLATVNIKSSRPRDVEMAPEADRKPEPVAAAPVSPPSKPAVSEPAPKPAPAVATKPEPGRAGTAAVGIYTLNLSAYASSASVRNLEHRVRALGYPVKTQPIRQGGKTLTRVTAGPFGTRAAAEAARLKITQSIPGAPARLESDASDQHGDAPASVAAGKAAARAGGFAVQVAAMGSRADANALRDKLRGAGYDGFVDSVNAGGRQLWRVRAGPQTQRADAERVRDQIKAKLGMNGNVVSVP